MGSALLSRQPEKIMTTVQIAHEVSATTISKIEAMLAETAKTDPNWNGAEFSIERADFTSIPGCESADAVSLLQSINRTIRGE